MVGIASLAGPWADERIVKESPVWGSMPRDLLGWCRGYELFRSADPELSRAAWALGLGLGLLATTSLLRVVRAEWPETLPFASAGVFAVWAVRLTIDLAALYLWGSTLLALPFCRPLHAAFYVHAAAFCACAFLTIAWTPFELWRGLSRRSATRTRRLPFVGAGC